MKIVQINTTYGYDSTGKNTKDLHNWLKEKGIQSYVFTSCMSGITSSDEEVYLFSSAIDEKIHAFFSRLFGLQGYFSHISTALLVHQIKLIRPDVVLLGNLHSNNINFRMLFSHMSKRRIPCVFVLHDCFFYTGHCCHYLQYNCDKWKFDCQNCEHIKDWNRSWIFNTAKKKYEDKKKWYRTLDKYAVVGVSDWILNEAKQSIMKDATILRRIYNWIDEAYFDIDKNDSCIREKYEIPEENKILFAAASGWSSVKGLDEIIHVSQHLSGITILVAGIIDEECLNDNIISVGVVSDVSAMAKLYSSADVFINGSKQESFGKTTAEAFACGTPVVAYNTSGSAELVDEPRGYVAELGNLDDFTSGVKRVLNNGKRSYSDKCEIFAKSNFSLNKCLDEYLTLFNELCKND